MVIEQTVEIHDDRRLTLNLPEETPIGRAKAAVTLVFETPGTSEKPDALSYRAGFMKRQVSAPPDFDTTGQTEIAAFRNGETPDGAARSFRGILKGRGITLERFREIQREDKALEDTADERLCGGIR
jgi:hypothetical protein